MFPSMEQLRTPLPSAQVLADILPRPGMVMARCVGEACGAVTALEFSEGLHRRLRLSSLARLEGALRCSCGARRGTLEPWPADLAAAPGAGRVFLFVA